MVQIQLNLSEEEDKIVSIYNVINNFKDKRKSIKHMILSFKNKMKVKE